MSTSVRFAFSFEPTYVAPARLFGVTPDTAWVEVSADTLFARFGRWSVETSRTNVAWASTSGPYAVPKTIGPAHLSFSDRGLTFATNRRAGTCIEFVQPVRGMDPFGLLRHRGLTVTVEDPAALAEVLDGRH